MALKKKYRDELISIIYKYLPDCKIYLFGSRATNEERHGSDIDIAIDNGLLVPYNIIVKILMDFDDTDIPMTIDLIDLNSKLDKKFKENILKEGVEWTD